MMEKARATTERLATAGIRIVASTDSKDRDGRIVHQDGWDLAPFKANPVLMFDHGYLDEAGRKIPIGRVGQIDVTDGRLMAGEITWAKDPFSQMVREMYEPSDGSPPIMQAASAGWIPTVAPVQREDGEHHTRQELAELSLTAIPSNRDTNAVIMAAFRGLVHGSATVEPAPVEPPVEPAPVEPAETPTTAPYPPTTTNEATVEVTVIPAEVPAVVVPVVVVPDEDAAAEATALLAPPETPAPAVETEEVSGEGSAPEQASGLTTRQQVERVASVTAQIADAMYRRLTGRLPD